MSMRECQGCGFKVMDDSDAEAPAGWLCELCAGKQEKVTTGTLTPPTLDPVPEPPTGGQNCTACGTLLKIPDDLKGKTISCPACTQAMTVDELGNVSEHDPFMDTLRLKAQENQARVRGDTPPVRKRSSRISELKEMPEEASVEPEEEIFESRPQVASFPLLVLVALPTLAGLALFFSPALLAKVEAFLSDLLPALGL